MGGVRPARGTAHGRLVTKARPVGCSQCGCDFIVSGDRVGGFSHCQDHAGLVEVEW